MTRETYHRQLRETQDAVLVLGSMVDRAIDRSVQSLRDRDLALARQVIHDDQQINQLRYEIEQKVLLLLTTQAPMASELRILAADLNIITDLERMGDHAAGVAKITGIIGNEPPLKPLVDIPHMTEIAREMLAASLQAFNERNTAIAKQIADRDDEVDALYNRVYRDLLGIMIADPGTIDRATHLLWVAHNLERIADRVTNICERVAFLATGRMQEFNTATR